jgi:phosphoribosyl 1,2-cyclic phosphodiesterase
MPVPASQISTWPSGLICDAGTGIISLGNKLISDDKHKELLILLSHFHWDHISGLPFFVPAFHSKYNISFFGPGDSKKVIKKYMKMFQICGLLYKMVKLITIKKITRV